MNISKLGIDFNKVTEAKAIAASIASEVQQFVNQYTTVAVERTLCRLIGIDGVDMHEVPLPNVVVDQLHRAELLGQGTLYFLGNAMLETKLNPQQIAEKIVQNELDITKLPTHREEEVKNAVMPYVETALQKISQNVAQRKSFIEKLGEGAKPYIYVIVATGNIYEDVVQAQAAARQGADIIAVIRTTGQSLLDYVPYGATTEGFGGTFATQENFRIMRKALDEVGEEVGRYIRLCNYCSGLCMPEIAAMGALERLDVMLNDALYGILFRDINPQRTLVDQYFSRIINGFAGVIINTGEDNYLTTADAFEEAHTVLASDLINEQLALLAGIPEEQMGLGHAFEMDPELENGFLYELAQAQLTREIFPKAPLKYMPPTKFMTGNIFKGHLQDALFNIIGIWTKQGIQLLGMPTEAIHTPFMSDRFLAIENAKYIFKNMATLGDEVEFKEDGVIRKRAHFVLEEAVKLLKEIEKEGLFTTLERGNFGNVKRPKTGGKGLQGVAEKSTHYFNPFIEKMKKIEKTKKGITSHLSFLIPVFFSFLLSPFFLFAQYTEADIYNYIDTYKEIAIQKMVEFKIPASITLAQGIFESGCGTSRLATAGNNHFGIKCHIEWQGDTIRHDDDERQECFRKYKAVEESYNDHSQFLITRPRYAKLFTLDIMDYKGWARELKAAGYATNPQYADRLISLIERFDIARQDTIYMQLFGNKIKEE